MKQTFSASMGEVERACRDTVRAASAGFRTMLPARLRRNPDETVFFLAFCWFAVMLTVCVVELRDEPAWRLVAVIGVAMCCYWMRETWRAMR